MTSKNKNSNCMTIYTHKENLSAKNYGEVLREFHYLRATDDDFKREYRSTEVGRYITDNYLTPTLEIETNSEEELGTIISNELPSSNDMSPTEYGRNLEPIVAMKFSKGKFAFVNESTMLQKYREPKFEGWVERLDNILLGLETHSPSINQISIDDLAKVIAEMKNTSIK